MIGASRFERESAPPSSRIHVQLSLVLEPFVEGRGYAPMANALSLDAALRYARDRGGSGRITRGGKVIGYWGSVPEEET